MALNLHHLRVFAAAAPSTGAATLAFGVLVLSVSTCLSAQQSPSSRAAAVGDSGAGPGADGRLFTTAEVRGTAVVLGVTAALMPFDQRITGAFRERSPQQSRVLRDGAKAFNVLGDPGSVIVSLGIYGTARALHAEHLADLGLHTTEALVLSGIATWAVKGVAGRQRPYLDPHDADSFAFARGFASGARTSFPSGHTSAAFAVASAITAETQHWWPGAPWETGALLYGGAGLVGLARIYDAKHWASDVVLAAGLGTVSGVSVVRFNHARPHNQIDRLLGNVFFSAGAEGTTRIGLAFSAEPGAR